MAQACTRRVAVLKLKSTEWLGGPSRVMDYTDFSWKYKLQQVTAPVTADTRGVARSADKVPMVASLVSPQVQDAVAEHVAEIDVNAVRADDDVLGFGWRADDGLEIPALLELAGRVEDKHFIGE